MKKELSVSMSLGVKARMFVQSVGESLAGVYSTLLEENVSVSQAWKILHATVAFTFAVFCWCNVLLHLLLVAWFVFTIWDCKRAGLK